MATGEVEQDEVSAEVEIQRARELDLALDVAIEKYLRHVPLEKQARRRGRQDASITGSLLWQELDKLAHRLQPTYRGLRRDLVEREVLHVGLHSWRASGKGDKRWAVWSLSCDRGVYYSLGTFGLRSILEGFEGGIIADDYATHAALARALPDVELALGWRCIERDLGQALASEASGHRARQLIAELFEIERDLPDWHTIGDDTLQGHALDYVRTIRNERCRPLCDTLLAWAERTRHASGTSQQLSQALQRMASHWPELVRFLDEPRHPFCERTAQASVFVQSAPTAHRSQRGTEVATLLQSLIETAVRSGVDAKGYLRAAVLAAARDGQALLPPAYTRTLEDAPSSASPARRRTGLLSRLVTARS
ncbi:MAG: transposase [Polyangiales bacterium]